MKRVYLIFSCLGVVAASFGDVFRWPEPVQEMKKSDRSHVVL